MFWIIWWHWKVHCLLVFKFLWKYFFSFIQQKTRLTRKVARNGTKWFKNDRKSADQGRIQRVNPSFYFFWKSILAKINKYQEKGHNSKRSKKIPNSGYASVNYTHLIWTEEDTNFRSEEANQMFRRKAHQIFRILHRTNKTKVIYKQLLSWNLLGKLNDWYIHKVIEAFGWDAFILRRIIQRINNIECQKIRCGKIPTWIPTCKQNISFLYLKIFLYANNWYFETKTRIFS